jgi:hypothetical protein
VTLRHKSHRLSTGDESHYAVSVAFLIYLAQGSAVIFALLAGWAWAKSAALSLNWPQSGWLDRQLNAISTNPIVWNAIAAFLSAGAAIFQGVAFLLVFPRG